MHHEVRIDRAELAAIDASHDDPGNQPARGLDHFVRPEFRQPGEVAYFGEDQLEYSACITLCQSRSPCGQDIQKQIPARPGIGGLVRVDGDARSESLRNLELPWRRRRAPQCLQRVQLRARAPRGGASCPCSSAFTRAGVALRGTPAAEKGALYASRSGRHELSCSCRDELMSGQR